MGTNKKSKMKKPLKFVEDNYPEFFKKLKIYTNHHHKWNTDGEESNSGNLKKIIKAFEHLI